MDRIRTGITIAGNLIQDAIKQIDSYPEPGMLTSIRSVSYAVGGCVPNTAIDLARIDPCLPVSVCGKVGHDSAGSFILNKLQKSGVNTDLVLITDDAPTSFTDVMQDTSGQRTFFQARGANALFAPSELPIGALTCKMLHLGYLLLLDCFDAADSEYGTAAARVLHELQKVGIRTSVDAVSSCGGSFAEIMRPALPYCDNLIINEIECCAIWGLNPYTADGKPDAAAIRTAMQLTHDAGVKERVIVHCPEAGFLLDNTGFTVVGSLALPQSIIAGSVGAGDAFCAGCLYGIYHGFDNELLLRFASCAAASSLLRENSVDGMQCKDALLQMERQFARKELN